LFFEIDLNGFFGKKNPPFGGSLRDSRYRLQESKHCSLVRDVLLLQEATHWSMVDCAALASENADRQPITDARFSNAAMCWLAIA
jgi:hypothetical protein